MKTTWGGKREPGNGKTLGRNPIDPELKKKPTSLSLTVKELSMLDQLCQYEGCRRSEFISKIINEKYCKNITSMVEQAKK